MDPAKAVSGKLPRKLQTKSGGSRGDRMPEQPQRIQKMFSARTEIRNFEVGLGQVTFPLAAALVF